MSASYLSVVAKWRAATMLDALKTHGWGKNQPVLFHVFSNNGGNMFSCTNGMLDMKVRSRGLAMPLSHSSQRYSKVRDYVRGVIYDSLPAHLTGRFHAPVRPSMMTSAHAFCSSGVRPWAGARSASSFCASFSSSSACAAT